MIQQILHSCMSLVLPSPCSGCGYGGAEYPHMLCDSCRQKILSGAPCDTLYSDIVSITWSCRMNKGALRECIKRFKYDGNRGFLPLFEKILYPFIEDKSLAGPKPKLLVPVPIHPSKREFRGFNQSELLAEVVTSRSEHRLDRHLLVKTRNTPSQTGLTKQKRINNLRGSFAVVDRLRVTGRSVILVDDITTTGATLEACARELLRAGARNVCALTLARTPLKSSHQ
ncbi:MAG: ComF family protein [Candidatus Tantalella remota]|nr:ComF family protein [Candidatus Tantalella remota]